MKLLINGIPVKGSVTIPPAHDVGFLESCEDGFVYEETVEVDIELTEVSVKELKKFLQELQTLDIQRAQDIREGKRVL